MGSKIPKKLLAGEWGGVKVGGAVLHQRKEIVGINESHGVGYKQRELPHHTTHVRCLSKDKATAPPWSHTQGYSLRGLCLRRDVMPEEGSRGGDPAVGSDGNDSGHRAGGPVERRRCGSHSNGTDARSTDT